MPFRTVRTQRVTFLEDTGCFMSCWLCGHWEDPLIGFQIRTPHPEEVAPEQEGQPLTSGTIQHEVWHLNKVGCDAIEELHCELSDKPIVGSMDVPIHANQDPKG